MNVLELKFKIDEHLYTQLVNQAKLANYSRYISDTGTSTSVQYSRIYDGAEIEELAKQIPFVPYGFMFLKLDANALVDVHTDDSKNRSSCLTIGLCPDFKNMAPIEYYSSLAQSAQKTQTYFYNKNAVIINTQLPHKVVNNNFDRYTFQIMYANPIEDFLPFSYRS
jgi:hypothetical protein